ncbi:MAG: DUF5996 family protein [Bacteroidota bacterium]
MNPTVTLPQLPLHEWEETKMTLHLILQIIGKVRLKMTPRKNHWWYITQYVSPMGITTSAIPYNNGLNSFEVILNIHKKRVEIQTSTGEEKLIYLEDGKSVAQFYKTFVAALKELGIEPNIVDKPFDLGIEKRFAEITEYRHFDWAYIGKFWKIMLWIDGVMNEFSGRFYGKTCPVQLYWHHLDLAVTRFLGKKGPALDPNARISDKDAYSHEVISFGFWAGDDKVKEPAFYSYTYPSPEGIDQEKLEPSTAAWVDSNGSPMAFLSFANLLKEEDPRAALLRFFESAYVAGATLAGWDMEELKAVDLEEL